MKKTLHLKPRIYKPAGEILAEMKVSMESRRDTLLCYWAFLNRLTYMVAVNRGLVEPSIESKQMTIKNLNNIKYIYSECQIQMALTKLQDHIKKHWQGAAASRPTLINVRKALAAQGVFSVLETKFQEDRRRRTPPAVIYGIDFVLCLELMELIEEILRRKGVVIPATELKTLYNKIEQIKANAVNTGEIYAQKEVARVEKKIANVYKKLARGKREAAPLHSGAFMAVFFKRLKSWASKFLVSIYDLVPYSS